MQQIAHRITALREARGISERQLAADSGIARVTLQRRMVDPASLTIAELERLAAALDTTATDLASGVAS